MSNMRIDNNFIKYIVSASLEIGHFQWFHKEWNEFSSDMDNIQPRRIAKLLDEENRKAWVERYNEECEPNCINEISFYTKMFYPSNPVQVLKSIDFYLYNSGSAYLEDTEAYAYLMSLRQAYVKNLKGYDDLVWGAPEQVGDIYRVI